MRKKTKAAKAAAPTAVPQPAAQPASPVAGGAGAAPRAQEAARRPRVMWSAEETRAVLEGEKMFQNTGRVWEATLEWFAFHPQRTAVDLKDKFRTLTGKRLGS